MDVFTEIGALRAFLDVKRKHGLPIGLVPTMGALHQGHTSLVKAAKGDGNLTVSSLFVNPTQFNNPSDLEKYPRSLKEDKELLAASGCDVLFAPDNTSMYESQPTMTIGFGDLEKIMEGKFRPGHFSGVGLVVAKLFNIVQPQHAYFGQKDFQQFQIITALVHELKFNLMLHCLPTIREADGLAMSSRNMRLSAEGRSKASSLFKSLTSAKTALLDNRTWMEVKEQTTAHLSQIDGIKPEYFELASRSNFTLINDFNPSEPSIILIAAFVDGIRLIDNLFVDR